MERSEPSALGVRTGSRFLIWLVIALTAATILAFLPILQNDFVNFDDDKFIVENPVIRGLNFGHLRQIFTTQIFTPNYKPLVYLSWAIEYKLFGLEPRVFHLGNLLLHAVNAVLVFFLFVRLGGSREGNDGPRPRGIPQLAFLAAALFATHPMKVESVAWATERKDVLFGMFFLLALLSYVSFCGSGRKVELGGSVLFYALALLSKGMAITLPAVLFLVDWWFCRRLNVHRVLEKTAHVGVLVGALWLYGAFVTGGPEFGISPDAGSWAQAMTISGYRYFTFLWRLFVPFGLAPVSPLPALVASPGWIPAAYLMGWLALTVVSIALWRASRWPALGLLFYSVTILPALALPVNPTVLVPDRYTYIPSLGWVALIVAAVGWIARQSSRGGMVVTVTAILGLLTLAGATYRQAGFWRTSETLWSHVLDTHGPMALAYSNRGVAKQKRGDVPAALDDFGRAIEADPTAATAFNNRGSARLEIGDVARAAEDLARAANLAPTNPLFQENLGLALARSGQLLEAIEVYNRSIQLAPNRPEAFLARGIAKREAGLPVEAIADFTTAIELGADPLDEAYLQRGIAKTYTADYREATEDNTRALAINPKNSKALNNRGYAQFYLGELEQAVGDYDRAIKLQPDYVRAYANRGDALMALGREEAACRDWRTAVQLGKPPPPELEQRLTEFCPASS